MIEFPPWASTEALRTEYLLRRAAVHHKRGGTLYTLATAIGRNRGYLRALLRRGDHLPAEDAARVELLVGSAVAPRQLLAPAAYEGWNPTA